MKVLCVIAVAFLFLARNANANPPSRPTNPDALRHLNAGLQLSDLFHWDEAIKEFEQGSMIEPALIFDYNLGQCHRQLNHYQEAISFYKRFIRYSPQTSVFVERAQQFIDTMTGEMTQQAQKTPPTEPVSDLHDERSAAATPLPPTLQPANQPIPPAFNASEPWYHDGVGYGLAGAGLAACAIGVGLLLDASSMYDRADGTPDQQQQATLRNDAHTRQLLGIVSASVGGVVLAGGVVKFALHHDGASSGTIVTMSPAGVAILGRF